MILGVISEKRLNLAYFRRLYLVYSDRADRIFHALRDELGAQPIFHAPREKFISAESGLPTRVATDNLQTFLLELGRGFSFVARQKRLVFEDDEFFVDLVFYNYLLKCFVLIDLKIGKLTHQDVGQMDSYIRLYEDLYKVVGDNPTIGLILCTQKNETIARYSMLKESQQLFATKYRLHLPTEEELANELKREIQAIEVGSGG